jgi:hypothetical protein
LNSSVLEDGFHLGKDDVFVYWKIISDINRDCLSVEVGLAECHVREAAIDGYVVLDVLKRDWGVVVQQDAWTTDEFVVDPISGSDVCDWTFVHHFFFDLF